MGSRKRAGRSCSGSTTSSRTPPTACGRSSSARSASPAPPTAGDVSRPDRYDTEIAFADQQIGRLLAAFDRNPELKASTLFVFAADHGESLGEHGYWGHGRNLYEPTLRIPLGLAWTGKIRPGTTIDAPALNLDVAPTILGLAGLPAPAGFRGFDWTPVLQGAPAPRDRVLWFEAHKGAVLSSQEAANARRKGLLEVGVMVDGRKQILHLAEGALSLFDLAKDPRETRTLAGDPQLSRRLHDWMDAVQKGLAASDRLGTAPPSAPRTRRSSGRWAMSSRTVCYLSAWRTYRAELDQTHLPARRQPAPVLARRGGASLPRPRPDAARRGRRRAPAGR